MKKKNVSKRLAAFFAGFLCFITFTGFVAPVEETSITNELDFYGIPAYLVTQAGEVHEYFMTFELDGNRFFHPNDKGLYSGHYINEKDWPVSSENGKRTVEPVKFNFCFNKFVLSSVDNPSDRKAPVVSAHTEVDCPRRTRAYFWSVWGPDSMYYEVKETTFKISVTNHFYKEAKQVESQVQVLFGEAMVKIEHSSAKRENAFGNHDAANYIGSLKLKNIAFTYEGRTPESVLDPNDPDWDHEFGGMGSFTDEDLIDSVRIRIVGALSGLPFWVWCLIVGGGLIILLFILKKLFGSKSG